MILSAPAAYSQTVWQQLLNLVRDALLNAFMKGQDVDLARGERLILHSSSGARWFVGASLGGVLTLTGDPGQLKLDNRRNSGLGLCLGVI